ncbi:MAG TPA: vanadium-dependent haloperoxidase [Gaiellaceae bacterium]|nr:vanadium-dependent haloperoxidase [Gaiellaceae bacterium]
MSTKQLRTRTSIVFAGTLAAIAVGLLLGTRATAVQASPPPPIPPDAVLTWNANAVAAVRASSPSKFQVEGMIYMSYVQAAVYDAVSKIEGRYVPYHDFAYNVVPGTSVQAAVAAAAQTTLDNYLPDQMGTVDGEYNSYIASLGGLGAPGVSDGVALGQAAANDIIALRTGDGRNAATPTYGTIGPIIPGQWQLQSAGQTAQTPWVATMRPFVLEAPSQFRVGPPPALTSQQYAKDLNEVEAYGSLNSTVRTQAETDTAYFWNANAINQYNGTMQNAVNRNGMDLVDAAHLFAMGELTTADAGIACFDSKYFYLAWRPITAIRHADLDGNDATTADPGWTPLLATPTHPEYPSAHGCLTSALTDSVAAALHTQHLDITIPGAMNGGTTLTTSRVFNNVQDIQNQVVDARVWIGFHFRNSVVQGENLGNDVAKWDLRQAFQPAG